MEQLSVETLHYAYGCLCLRPVTADGKITVIQLFIAYNRWGYGKIHCVSTVISNLLIVIKQPLARYINKVCAAAYE